MLFANWKLLPTSPSSVYRYIVWLGPVTILWAHFSMLMRVHCEIGGMGLDSFCLQLRQRKDAFLVFGPSGRLHCSRNVNPRGGQGNREAYVRDIRRGRTTSAFHGEAVSWRAEKYPEAWERRPQGGGGRQGSDTSSCFKGPKPGHSLAAPPSLPSNTTFSSGFFLPPSALFIFSVPLRKGQVGEWRGGERRRMTLVVSVAPPLAKPVVAVLEISATERCTFWNSSSRKPLRNSN